MADNNTSSCRKCQSQIPLEAERCSKCGFEPKVGLIGQIFVWLSFMLGSTFLVIALSALIIIADGYPITDGLVAFGLSGVISLIFFGYIYSKWEVYRQKPAIQPEEDIEETDIDLSEISDELRESRRKGRERGESIRKRLDESPSAVWTIGVLVGVLFGVGTWILAAQELENAMVIALIASMVFVTLSIMADVGRLNRTTGMNFKWWVYVVPAVIPLIGWLFGFIWLARKKQKTGSALR